MRRSRLFATSLSIENFRGYGRFRLDLPAEPCVVLLSGPNGLGKTSLFEAIEWSLTDSVRRLDLVANGRVDRREIVRRAPGVDAFEVRLSFEDQDGNEESISRTQVVPKGAEAGSVGTTLDAVAELLRADDEKWKVSGANIGTYLHLTHVHAQMAALRFVTSTSKERWVKVRPLAGAERFDRVLLNLTNTKQALTRLAGRAVTERDVARERKQRWDALLLRLAQAQSLAAAVRDVLSPKEVVERLRDSASALGLLPVVHSLDATDDLVAAGEWLRAHRDAVELARTDTDARLKTIARLRTVVRQHADLRVLQAQVLARVKDLETNLVAARTMAEAVTESATLNREAHETARAVFASAQEEHERLQLTLQIRSELRRFDAEAPQLKLLLEQAERAAEEAEVEHRKRVEDQAAHEKLAADGDAQRRRLRLVEEGIAAVTEIEALEKQLALEDGRVRETEGAIRTNDAATQALVDERAAAAKTLVEAEGHLQSLRVASEEFQRALLVVSEYLSDETTHCPVCSSQFALGALKALARDGLAKRDPAIAAAELRVSSLRGAQELLQKREAQLARERRKAEADLRGASDKVVQLREMIAELRRREPLNAIQGTEYRPALGRVRDDATKNLLRIEKALDAGRAADAIRQAVVDAAAKVDTARRARAAERERSTARAARISELRARRALLVDDQHADPSDQRLQHRAEGAAARAAATRAAAEATAAKNAESIAAEAAAQKAVAAHAEALARETGQRPSIDAGLLGFENEWRAAGFSLPLSEAKLNAEEEQLGLRRTQLAEVSSGLPLLSASLERWHEAEELQRLETEVRREQGALSREEHSRVLDEALNRANRSVNDTNRARRAADELGNKLQDITADFGEAALKPFDALFRRYLKALIHDDRFHEIEATYE